jgi:hypothetical protein
MADAVAFTGIEEKHMVPFSYGLVMPKVAHIDAAIWKHQFSDNRIFFGTLLATTLAAYVTNPRVFVLSRDWAANSGIEFTLVLVHPEMEKQRFPSV